MDSFFPEDVIETLSKTFWQRVSAVKGLIERHQSFRLLWFGEALKRNRNWTGVTAEQAVNRAISEHHGLLLADVRKMTIAQKWVALVPLRKALYSRPDGKTFQWLVEKKLDELDRPCRFSA
ncbi:hypothetical protein [Pantoea sp. SJZ147]|uniref:hypothetical protein n=1 Tax=Pantoea TaxID=53335 RepID=UPI00119FB2A0|nr:hypothetical protein [Pantoea sp. SJZ147]TWD37375.1 hypothetical protein FBY13_1097 [Pantoea sp. SJZ147]